MISIEALYFRSRDAVTLCSPCYLPVCKEHGKVEDDDEDEEEEEEEKQEKEENEEEDDDEEEDDLMCA